MTRTLLILIPVAYLLGSIPFGLLVGRMKGIDVRTAGSGNIGATNVGRLLGKKFFFLVFFLDMLKSLVPMIVASTLVRHASLDSLGYFLWLAVGGAAVVGHMFSLFLNFKGGKGVATSAGVVLGLYPYYTLAGLAAIVVFIVAFFIWRYVSLGSMLAAISFPVAFALVGKLKNWPVTDTQWPLLAFAILMAVLIVFKHRGNISRLINGTENRFAKPPT
jgi:glycerol-3-phosphate acyltransferase PlsY